ncbi:glycerophosphodiester phosphodiesterase family protein [Roseibium polysiphoniae]|uniref:glycerophosphodiester phosphodiesterase n=1 Tax=Roseibium polysiphoniae TaxID=2571221 RepID=A0ABR9C6H0_9HYPH|nr:glycerophosphodiester phosphodiesterase family protein [Roseibium polysiphoniae]MBD8875104.1 glycerophosphodiester phosphodiesterase [Roseibium polysiphoniae]
MHRLSFTCLIAAGATLGASGFANADTQVHLGPRPLYLVDQMEDGALKDKLLACAATPAAKTDFSIGHRGAALQFPEHTAEGYVAAARMGAGIIECDVTFTKDKELVCRHAQDDLHTSTNILATDLADKCTQSFTPAGSGSDATAECRTSDLTLAEFMSLKGKMDGRDKTAATVEDYMAATAGWRTDLYAPTGTLMTHAQSIELIKAQGGKFTPELKSPAVKMPFDGFSQADYARKMIDEYKAAGVAPEDVWPQSFNLDDVLYWIENEPEFGKQAVYLDGRYGRNGIDPSNAESFKPSMEELKDMGVNYLAPPIWMMLALDDDKQIVPSVYALAAKEAGLKLIAWTLERSGPLASGGGWYFQTVKDAMDSDGKLYEVLNVLSEDVGVEGVFSDWPATVTYYANCMGK